MAEFLTETDIGNRALQHVGAELMDAALGFSEVSKSARQVSFVYGKARRAELRRNVWTFATRRAVLRPIGASTMVVVPALWVASTIYFVGSLVSDENNRIYMSRIPDNLGHQPQSSTTWEPYFGPLTVSLYASGTTYQLGELVYTTDGAGTVRVYLSLANGNADNPATPTAWSATTTYFKDDVVTYLSVAYMSKIDLNLNQTPSASPANWSATTTYTIGQSVNGSDGTIYTSRTNGNINHDPTTDGGVNWTNTGVLTPWTTVFVGGTGSSRWLQIGGPEFHDGVALSRLAITYPVGSGPSTQSAVANAYRLPAGYLRTAPQNPKAGANSYLGAPGGDTYRDWLFENNYIVTGDADPIVFRFVADVNDVTAMDDMFCEGLACRIAEEVCEALTQSTAKLASIRQLYKDKMGEARAANAIESGAEEPPEDDYITTRA